ncbi:hypothetical protein [Allorhodopirellula heiligendammensis]|uniref:Uncharacterized protein n=1 Tax=Allorhodopirellula heiligendammensis TaxID=2714739 RepID=A0A5C6B2B8_9BACT|nr:hypothetical protein [Allorhodopirellula heiligendammensis]TWU05376.1 hypothetical protein Poly21_57160 [Allorhodopirellula heiligendammensis]
MKLMCLATVLALTAWLDATASTYELAAVATAPTNSHQRDVELRFTAPEDAEVRITADGVTVSKTSRDLSNARLSFKLDEDRADGSEYLTFLVGFGTAPNCGTGRTVKSDSKLDLKLKIAEKPTSVPYGETFTVGHFNGKPITIYVKPKPTAPGNGG